MKRKPGILEQTCGKDVVSGISTNLFYDFLKDFKHVCLKIAQVN